MKRSSKRADGFTLMEILIVVAIIAILVAVSIPIFTSQLERARAATCAANRRSLLAAVRVEAMQSGADQKDVFAAMYAEHKDEYPCPDGGTFTWVDEHIECSKHPAGGGSGTSGTTVKVSDTYTSVALDPNVDSTVRVKGDKMKVVKGTIYRIGDNYYIANDNYTNLTVGSDYASWLTSNYYATKVNFAKTYSQADLGSGGVFGDYSKAQSRLGTGSVYEYNGSLYVQSKRFDSTVKGSSSDPAANPGFWTLLGTIK